MKKAIIIFLFTVVINQLNAQNTVTIEGLVKSENTGLALPNATIHSIVANQTTNTGKDGRFKIKIASKDTLITSYVGYDTLIKSVSEEAQKIELTLVSTAKSQTDVIINTGYQQLKPNEVNGSFVVIDNKTLNQQTGLNILDRLNGVTSGLSVTVGKRNTNPNSNTNITIRGESTINGPLDPLIIVDNFIYNGNINNINPNDVESVTVLKDAAAASIWGARAGNGVIVITTKKGAFNEKIKIDFNSDVIVTEKPKVYSMPQISSADYIDFEQELFNNGYYNFSSIDRFHKAITPAVQVFQDRKNGIITAKDSMDRINELKKIDNRSQFLKYYSKTGILQQYALNVRGGNSNIAWLISGTYDSNSDNSFGTYNKINLRFENTYRPLKKVLLTAGVYYTNSTSVTGQLSYSDVTSINNTQFLPYKNLAGKNGEAIPILWTYSPRYTDTVGHGALLDWNNYAVDNYKHQYEKENIEAINAHLSIKYNVNSDLDLSLMYQYNKEKTNLKGIRDENSYYTRDLINRFSQLDATTGTVTNIIPLGGIININNTSRNSYNFRGQINYNKTFRSHQVRALAGIEIRDDWLSGEGTTFYGYTEDPLTYTTNLDYLTPYPTIVSGSKSTIPTVATMAKNETRFLSLFTNASYTFKTRYSINASLRKDGSNIFGATANDKWNPLWSYGLGWQISNEQFFQLDWVSYLKLSTTYGVSGNIDPTKSPLPLGRYATIPVGQTVLPTLWISALNNPELSWEKSFQNNFRLDFTVKNEIISGSLEYYLKKGENLYAPTPYDYTTNVGATTVTANVANSKGHGIDILLNTKNINKKFKWSTTFLYNYNQSITTKYYTEGGSTIYSLVGGNNKINPVVGKPLYAIAAYKWGGLDKNGNPQGYLNGKLSTDYYQIMQNARENGIKSGSIKYMGAATPTSFGSILNQFSFKGLMISFNLTYKFGYYFMKIPLSYTSLASYGEPGGDYGKRWKQPGDELKTSVPSFTYPLDPNRDYFYKASTLNVLKGDHIRLQFVNLSYSLPTNFTKKMFKSVNIYLNASNLGILWKANHEHIDPDYNYTLQPSKTFTIGLKANL